MTEPDLDAKIAALAEKFSARAQSDPPPRTKPAKLPDIDLDKLQTGWEFDDFGDLPAGKVHARHDQIITGANPACALQAAKTVVLEMARNSEPRWLTLCGPSGLGKTHLARRIFRKYHSHIEEHVSATTRYLAQKWRTSTPAFVEWPSMVGMLKRREWGRMDEIRGNFLLVLDDVLRDHEQGAIMAALFELLSRRLNMWTIVTINLGYEQIAEREAAIASRLIRDGNKVVELTGKDYNLVV